MIDTNRNIDRHPREKLLGSKNSVCKYPVAEASLRSGTETVYLEPNEQREKKNLR